MEHAKLLAEYDFRDVTLAHKKTFSAEHIKLPAEYDFGEVTLARKKAFPRSISNYPLSTTLGM